MNDIKQQVRSMVKSLPEHGDYAIFKEIINDSMDEIERLEKQYKWIAVEDELPKWWHYGL